MPGLKERLAEESERAEALINEPAASTASVVDSTVSSVVQSAPESVAQPAPVANEVDKLKSQVTELSNQVTTLKHQLEDENNPTNKSRWLTLKGICAKQIETIKLLEDKIKELSVPSAPATPSASVEDDAVLNKLKQDYGDTVVAAIENLATKKAESLVSELKEKLTGYEAKLGSLETSATITKEDLFFSDLEKAVPGWKKINGWPDEGIVQDSRFTSFAFTEVPGTDYTYNDVLINAYSKLNANGVAKVFKLFLDSIKTVPAPAVAPVAPKGPSLDDLVDPGNSGAGSGTIVTQPKKKTYTRDEVEAFYNDVAKRRYRGTMAERNALDKEYQEAIMEGRVQ